MEDDRLKKTEDSFSKLEQAASLRKKMNEIRQAVELRRKFVTEEEWKRNIGTKPDRKLGKKVNEALLQFCELGYMDRETFEKLRPYIRNQQMLEILEKYAELS